MATDVARLALAIDVTGAKRAQSAMESIRSGSVRLTRATEEQIAASRRLNSTFQQSGTQVGGYAARLSALGQSFRVQKGSAAQFGQQLQDVTIQAQAGTNAFTIIAQQGGQVASLFGPGGALLGAFVSIAAVIGGVFYTATRNAAESTETLTERIGALRDNVDELTEAQIRGLRVEFFAANRDRAAAIQAERENIRSLTQELTNLKEAERAAEEQALMSGGMTPQLAELQSEIRKTSQEIEIAKGSLQTYYSEADNAAVELKELIEGNDDTAKSAEKAAEKIREMVEAAEQQAATIGLSSRAVATYEAALAGANAEQILAIDQAYQRIEAEKLRMEQIKQTQEEEEALAKMRAQGDPAFAEFNRYADQIDQIEQFNITAAEKDRLREQAFMRHQENMAEIARKGTNTVTDVSAEGTNQLLQQQQQLNAQVVSTFGNVLGAIRGFTEQGTAEWVAMTIAQKGIMAGQAIMAANLAAAQTLSASIVPGDPSSPLRAVALAETIRNLGYVNAGLIVAQGVGEIAQSFDGGGYTGNGPRSGGLDGKGGFMAMMHPQETVIDHTRGQGMGGDVNVIVNNAPPGTRTEERMDGRGNRFVEVFIADIASGGPMSKAVQGTYGLRRQGR